MGEHIIFIGDATEIEKRFDRLETFYRCGLSKVGWNKYKYISVEFSNQIICKRNDTDEQEPPAVQTPQADRQQEQAATSQTVGENATQPTTGNSTTQPAAAEKQQSNKNNKTI